MRKVITYGTFDLFHQGHYNIIKRARELGDYLIVGVTSESFDIERGKLNVRDSLMKRIENVRATGLADEIVIEEYQGQKVQDIIKYNVDVFVVGSDWRGKFDYLKEYCEVFYLERTKSISSTMIREQQQIYKIGVITDELDDKGVTIESKYISGASVEKVYAEQVTLAENFCQKYELASFTTELEDFFNEVDIVFINMPYEKRAFYVNEAIKHKKYVICNAPIVKDSNLLKQYIELAAKQQVLIIDNIITGYLRAFTQLVWLLRYGLVGDIIRVHCSLSQNKFRQSKDVDDMLVYSLLLSLRILGLDYQKIDRKEIKDADGNVVYKRLTIQYDNALADIEISNLEGMEDGAMILGTAGRVEIPDDWWNMGYFEAIYTNEKKRFSYNFEGNGLRYLLQEAMIMISDKRKVATRVFNDEILKIADILAK